MYNREGRLIRRGPDAGDSPDSPDSPGASVTLGWMVGEDPGYPFPLELRVTYRLLCRPEGGTAAEIRFDATNRGKEAAPAGFGWHPYFRIAGAPVAEYRITIPAETFVEVREDLMPTGRILPVSVPAGAPFDFRAGRRLGSDSFDTAFPVTESSARTSCIEAGRYRVSLSVTGTFSYFQLFTPPDPSSVALEPLTNVTDAFNRTDMGMRVLEPGDRLSGAVEITVIDRFAT